MDKNLQNIEDLFRKGLEDNEEIPPESTWDHIDKILDRDKIISINKKNSLLKRLVFLLIFLLAALCIYHWNNSINRTAVQSNSDIIYNGGNAKNNTADLSSAVRKYTNEDNNHRLRIKISKSNFDSNTLKETNKKSEESISSLSGEKAANSPVSNYNKKTEKTMAASNINLSTLITKQGNTKEDKLGIQTFSPIENEQAIILKDSDYSIKKLLSASPVDSLPDIKIKSTTDLIQTKKIFQDTAPSKAVLKMNSSKNIFQTQKNIRSQNKSQFYITVFFSPEVSFSRMQDNHSGNQSGNPTDNENGERDRLSNTMGALVEYKTVQNWSWQSGFTVSTTSIDVDPRIIYAKADNTGTIKYQINTSSGYCYILPSFSNNPNVGDSILSRSTTTTLQYAAIPLSVKYSFNKGKFILSAMTGISLNFLMQGKITTDLQKGNDNEMETAVKIIGLKKFYLSGMTGVGLDYNFYKCLSANFSPTFRFTLNPISDEAPVKSFPNSLGCNLGINLGL